MIFCYDIIVGRKTFLILVISFCVLLFLSQGLFKNHPLEKQNRVCFKNHCFDLELALTPKQRSTGLSFREKLDSQRGMFFVFDEVGKHPFWMKNTFIPLDIIWINESSEIVFISENTQPCKESPCPTIEPTEKAKYVLEINGGLSKKIGLAVGDKISIESSKL